MKLVDPVYLRIYGVLDVPRTRYGNFFACLKKRCINFRSCGLQLLTSYIPYHYRVRDGMVIKDIQGGVKPPGPDGFTINECSAVQNKIRDLLYDHCWSLYPSGRRHMGDIVSQLEDIYDCREHLGRVD